MTAGRPRFVVFEGGEGAGKTTHIAELAERLRAAGEDPLVTREPGGTPEGAELRRLLLTEAGADWTPEAETLLMVADRAQHVRRTILPALEAGRAVVCDRYVGSTLAYQGGGRGVARSWIEALHREACADLWPDLTILLDIDPRLGLARSRRRLGAAGSDESRFEGLDLAFHDRVRRCFLDLAAGSRPVAVIDASAPLDAVRAAVRAAISGMFSA